MPVGGMNREGYAAKGNRREERDRNNPLEALLKIATLSPPEDKKSALFERFLPLKP